MAPRTDTERALAEIWGTLLGRERIGAEDNFFHLGGDSILSIQVASRARQAGLAFTPGSSSGIPPSPRSPPSPRPPPRPPPTPGR
ncbi:phosphopantetheine-binding protein [Streptomyces indonesiensis]